MFRTSVIFCSEHRLCFVPNIQYFFVPNIGHFLFRTSVILCSEHPVYFLSEHLDGFHSEHPEKRFYVLYPLPDTRSNSRMFGRARTKKDKPDFFHIRMILSTFFCKLKRDKLKRDKRFMIEIHEKSS